VLSNNVDDWQQLFTLSVGGGILLPTRGGVMEEAVSLTRNLFSIFELKKARFGASWVLEVANLN